MSSGNYPQLKTVARASLKNAVSGVLIVTFVLPTVFSLLLPSEARAAATISKSLRRPVNEIGLVGWWTFDGPDMLTNVSDNSGQGDNGSLILGASGNTATTTVPGRVGQALSFDGINDYVTMGASYNGVQSVAFWIKIATSTTLQKVIDLNGTATVTIDSGTLNGNNFTSPTRYVDGVAASTINDILWHHVVITTGTAINASALDVGRITATYLGGSLDDVRFYNRALSASEITRLYQIGATSKIATTLPGRDSLTSGLVGWWTFDGPDMLTNVADKSGQGNNGSLSHAGSGTTTTAGRVGQALSFDGTNDYVSIGDPGSGILDFGTNSFSYGLWVYVTSSGTAYDTSWWKGGSSLSNIGYDMELGTGNWQAGLSDGTNTLLATFGTETLNQWVHLFAIVDRSATRLYVYRNGVLANSPGADISAYGSLSSTNSAYIGTNDFSYYFKGKIDDVRVYNRALSAAEVLQLYRLGATSKVAKTLPGRDSLKDSSLVGWWTFDGADMLTNVADKSGQGNNGKFSHSGSGTTTTSGRLGQAMTFDGSNDFSYAAFSPPTSNQTYSAWIKTTLKSTEEGIVTFSDAAPPNSVNDRALRVLTDQVQFYITDAAGSSGFRVLSGTTVTDNNWHHVVGVADGSTCRIYVDGVDKNNVACSGIGGYTGYTTPNFSIGSARNDANNATTYFNGSIDDVRVYNRALSAAEVLQLYNLGR